MQMPTVADAKNNNQTKAECQMTKEMTYKKKPKAKIQKIKNKKNEDENSNDEIDPVPSTRFFHIL